MAFYALLATTTAVICFLGILLWLRTRNVGFLVGIVFLYFWSLWGIAADADGNVVVSDNFNMRAGRYRGSDGMFQHGFGDYVAKPGEFIYPRSLSVREEDGSFAVMDRGEVVLAGDGGSISEADVRKYLTV